MTDIEFLSKVKMFEGLSNDELESLRECFVVLDLAPGKKLFKQGQAGQNLYIVRKGCVDIELLANQGRSVKITSLKKGECFGELSALDGIPRSATAVAAEKTTLLEFPKDRFMAAMEDYPVIAKNLLMMLSSHVRTTNNWVITFEGQANVDKLTGLYNRRWFDKMLEQEYERSNRSDNPLTILLVDVDHFKSINDRYGHLTGDQVLMQLSRVLYRGVRTMDLLARMGGEEFAVILPETTQQGAADVAERIRDLVEKNIFFDLDGERMDRVTISIGIAEKKLLETPNDLIAKGDRALYLAKSSGRNCVKP